MMTGKDDDIASTREDSFLAELVPQAAEQVAEQHAGDYDAEDGRARFQSWLAGHTERPVPPASGEVQARTRHTRQEASHSPVTSPSARHSGWIFKIAAYAGLKLAYLGLKKDGHRDEYRADLAHITTLHPHTYNDARAIGEHFRAGIPVIINLTGMTSSDAKRLVDFLAGLVFALRGSIERVTDMVFLLSPASVEVTAEDKARIAEHGTGEAELLTGNFRAELDPGKQQIHGTDRVLGEEPAHARKAEEADMRFLTVAEVAVIMRISKMDVYRLVHRGALDAIRVGRSFRVPEEAVNRYMRFYPTGGALEATGRPRR